MKKALIFTLAVVLGLLFCAQVRAATLQRNLIPADTAWVLHLDIERVLSSNLFDRIRQHPDWDRMESRSQRFAKRFHVDPLKDINSFTVYGKGQDEDSAVVCIEGRFDKAHLLDLLALDEDHREMPYGGTIIYNWDRHEYGAFAGDNMVLITKNQGMLEAALDVISGAKPDITQSPAGTVVSRIPQDSLFFAFAHNISSLIIGKDTPAVLRKAETALLHAAEKGSDLFMQAEMSTISPQDADNIEQILKGLLAMVDMYREEIPAGFNIPEDVEISRSGNLVRVALSYPVEELLDLLAGRKDFAFRFAGHIFRDF